ncbi:hypothetical protein CFC21_000685 [Triticum aestivum]|uniref:Uncharacterized protein n=1 Tax=Triticum aestivum TaxID=4565 RepID=A0A3B5XUX1_WHEAT|nr:uncharacterized protein LOC119361903 [Triticum dicoccoides]XP_044365132.1 uncharacterized protein LOC123087211 isoform X1 [Triticum aestivum]KAF6982270.1 hypothetical protein CFC21_000685 [Triticum aestivum]
MARLLSFVPISLLLLASLAAGAGAAAAADPGEGGPRISTQYASEEESRWLDRWAEKHLPHGHGSGQAIEIQPGSDEESAQLSRMFPGNAYIGHIEYDKDHPFGRIVVDAFHSKARQAKPNDDPQNHEESHSHAEHDVKDL